MKNWVKILLFCVSLVVFIGCDRITKNLAKEYLMYHEPISYLHNTLRLEYAENTGAAMSLGDQLSKPVSFLATECFSISILIVFIRLCDQKVADFNIVKLLAFSLIVAGGLGNVIDRILFDRHVTDFMNVGINNIRTGIFNVADMCVTAGVIMLLFSFREQKKQLETESDL